MSTLALVQVVALVSSGLKAGGLLGDRMGVHHGRRALAPASFVRFEQVQLSHWERYMPAVSSAALLAGIAWTLMILSRIGTAGFALVALATATHLASMLLAITGCMPVNRQLMSWNVASPPAGVMTIWARWERVNGARTVLAVIGFVSLALAFVL